MIHPTRTNLLLLKEKSLSVDNSVAILKARRQALIREFLKTTAPFLKSREELKSAYAAAARELRLTLGHEGTDFVASLEKVAYQDLGLEMTEQSVLGLRYQEIAIRESPIRLPEERGYDYRVTTPHLEEAVFRFEEILEEMLRIAAFESKLKRLGEEILRLTRRVRVLEERIKPAIEMDIRKIRQYIGERERETYYRLKRFKGRQAKG